MIRLAQPDEADAARGLLREYARGLGNAICFRSFEREVSELPERYPVILLAFEADQLAGCVAMRTISAGVAEMKRLYVRPAFQGLGLGRELAETMIQTAKAAGFHRLRLDTLPHMERAIALYRMLGFREIPPYGDNPAEALCFELAL